MYSPGNSVIVNILMRWPVLIPVVACCAFIVTEVKPTPPSVPVIVASVPVIPDPVVVVRVTPVIKIAPCPKGTKRKNSKCVRG